MVRDQSVIPRDQSVGHGHVKNLSDMASGMQYSISRDSTRATRTLRHIRALWVVGPHSSCTFTGRSVGSDGPGCAAEGSRGTLKQCGIGASALCQKRTVPS